MNQKSHDSFKKILPAFFKRLGVKFLISTVYIEPLEEIRILLSI